MRNWLTALPNVVLKVFNLLGEFFCCFELLPRFSKHDALASSTSLMSTSRSTIQKRPRWTSDTRPSWWIFSLTSFHSATTTYVIPPPNFPCPMVSCMLSSCYCQLVILIITKNNNLITFSIISYHCWVVCVATSSLYFCFSAFFFNGT